MKKGIKTLSVALAALALMTSSVSAADIWKHQDFHKHDNHHDDCYITCPNCGEVITDYDYCGKYYTHHTYCAPSKSDGTVYVSGKYGLVPASDKADPRDPATIFVDGHHKGKVEKDCTPVYCEPTYTPGKNICKGDLWGAKYYSRTDAKKALEEYFAENTYDMYMYEGQEKTFCSDAYFYSSDPETVYYDYKSGTLVANKGGTAHIYVYTEGGVPFFKLNVYVDRDFYHKETPATLNIVPDSWRLEVGESTKLTITASDGKVYDDIVVKIASGKDKVKIGMVSGKLTAEENGAVVVHAYSKSHSSVNGDALIYIGPYTNAITDGGWKWTNNSGCISVDKWCPSTDWCGNKYSCVNGWIKSKEGILIPVIKVMDVTVNDKGETYDTTAVIPGSMSYIDLLRQAYGCKDDVCDIIDRYNFYKYGIVAGYPTKPDCKWDYNWGHNHGCDYDWGCSSDNWNVDVRMFLLSQMYKDIIG